MGSALHSEWDMPELESIASLAENLVYRLPGCDDILIRKTLQEVAREFVSDTKCLTTHQPLTPDADGVCYPTPYVGVVDEVREVFKNGHRLRKGVDWVVVPHGIRLSKYTPEYDDAPTAAFSAGSDAVRFTPRVNQMDSAPSASVKPPRRTFSATVVEALPLFSEKLPKDFLRRHADAICSGVLGRLFSMSGKAWSDPQQAADERHRYDDAKSVERMRQEFPSDGQVIDTSELL